MNPGVRNCRVVLERLLKVPDDSGGYAEEYQPYGKAWVQYLPVRSSKNEQAEQMQFQATYEVVLPYRKDVLLKDRIFYQNRYFYQTAPAVNVEQKKAYLKLTVEEVFMHE